MVLTRSQTNKTPPFESVVEEVLVEEEIVAEKEFFSKTMGREEEEKLRHKEEFIEALKPCFEGLTMVMLDMNKQMMKGFELLGSQLSGKGMIGDNSGSHSGEKMKGNEHIFSSTGPHNRPDEFQST